MRKEDCSGRNKRESIFRGQFCFNRMHGIIRNGLNGDKETAIELISYSSSLMVVGTLADKERYLCTTPIIKQYSPQKME